MTLAKMSPALPRADTQNDRVTDAKVSRKRGLTSISRAGSGQDALRETIRNCGVWMTRTFQNEMTHATHPVLISARLLDQSQPIRMENVVAMGTPFKILNRIVRLVPIFVIRSLAWCRKSLKRGQDQSMDPHLFSFVSAVQKHMSITAGLLKCEQSWLPKSAITRNGRDATHPTTIADFIIREMHHATPLFHVTQYA